MPDASRVVLQSPDGRTRRAVLRGTPHEKQLREKGWRERPGGPPPEAGEGSRTAAAARTALPTLSAEEWVRDWGEVLCAALDESERARGWLVGRVEALAEIMSAGLVGFKAVAEGCLSWMRRTGWKSGRPVLEPTAERQAAAEDLVRAAMETVSTFRRSVDRNLGAAWDSPASAGNPAARARGSEILAQLARELPEELPAEQRERLRASIAAVRAAFLGGSNVPPAGGAGEPS